MLRKLTETAKSFLARSGALHSVPVFEGTNSRRHRDVSNRYLKLMAFRNFRRHRDATNAGTVLLFVGAPRSGHSLVGAIVDAHPNARVSHELDMVGLVEQGFRWWQLAVLMSRFAQAFRAHGQHWNGLTYRPADPVPEAAITAIGDKKGDWTVRRIGARPALLSTLRRTIGSRRIVYIQVVRNPFDNIATMSLRKGRHYDRVRIADRTGMGAVATSKRIPAAVRDDMLADYEGLCQGMADIKSKVPVDDWITIHHEDLVADPVKAIETLFARAGLPVTGNAVRSAASLVTNEANATRHQITWTDRQVQRIDALRDRHAFLSRYAFDDAPARRGAAHFDRMANDMLSRVTLVSCLGVRQDLALLPHFLKYYLAAGIQPDRMNILLNAQDPGDPYLADAQGILDAHGVASDRVWIGPYSSEEMWSRRCALQLEVAHPSDWIVSADIDEFHVYQDGLAHTVFKMEQEGRLLLQGPMVDRISADGVLRSVDAEDDLFRQFPIEGDLMCQLGKPLEDPNSGGTVTLMLYAATYLPGSGGHSLSMPASLNAAKDRTGQDADVSTEMKKLSKDRLELVRQRKANHVHGDRLSAFARLRDPVFRMEFPNYVAHFKWHSGLKDSIRERRASGRQSEFAKTYTTRVMDYLERKDWQISLDDIVRFPARSDAPSWDDHADQLRRFVRQFKLVRGRALKTRQATISTAPGWDVRQLTMGSGSGVGHTHSYYDIPVLDPEEELVASVKLPPIPNRAITAKDTVRIGLTSVADGGFRDVAQSLAWSWQQGPMLQWRPHSRSLVWNDRKDGRFVAMTCDVDPSGKTIGSPHVLSRSVYAIGPAGDFGLSLDMERLDMLRPGYGYAADGRRGHAERIPAGDGVWRVDFESGAEELILSVPRAVDHALDWFSRHERAIYETLRQNNYFYWFNHAKIAPDGQRFTVKLRWRLKDGPWNDLQGVSVTCDTDGSDLRVIGHGSSHVMWQGSTRLYYWSSKEGALLQTQDVEAGRAAPTELNSEVFQQNIHLRQIAGTDAWVFDLPYQKDVRLAMYRQGTESVEDIATFPNHSPPRGIYRCDLHPVPFRGGNRVLVTSLADGCRQLYLAERRP